MFKLNRIASATLLALGTMTATAAFAATPVSQGTTSQIAYQPSDQRGDVSDLTWRANQMDALISNNNGPVLTSDPSLGNQWMNRIVVSGQLNVDAAIAGRNYQNTNTTAYGTNNTLGNGFNSGYSSGLWLNNSELDVDAQVASWVKAHIALTGQDQNPMGISEQKLSTNDNWIDEAYITLGDLTKMPVYGTVGREYVPFGHYDKRELTPALTTYLTETQATAANLGFVTPVQGNNLYGSIYGLSGLNKGTQPSRIQNFGADLGLTKTSQVLGYSAGVSYLQNLADTNAVSNLLTGFGTAGTGAPGSYTTQVPAISGYLQGNYGPFNAEADGVYSFRQFNPADMSYTTNGGTTFVGAQPAAVNGKVGYNFSTLSHDSEAYFRYGHTWEASALALPQNQYLGGYNVNLTSNTTMEFQVMYNDDYSVSDGGSGKGDIEGAARLSVMF